MLRSTRVFNGFKMSKLNAMRRMLSTIPQRAENAEPNILAIQSDHIPKSENNDIITQVLTKTDAKRVLEVLYKRSDVHWACDTETTSLDLKTQGPVGNGSVTCVSIYGGPDVDFGDGPGSALWIDNIDNSAGLLQEFKDWFEDDHYKKVWHNYGFDRHVMFNEGIDCRGFAGDTMHMARLWNTGLDKTVGNGAKGYSLAALTELLCPDHYVKTSMKEIFGVGKILKNGMESKVKELPDMIELQRSQQTRPKWIQYSARDAVSTWHVWDALRQKLRGVKWVVDNRTLGDMYNFYTGYFSRFGELLTDMERIGIKVDHSGHLREAERRARADRDEMEKLFLAWATNWTDNAHLINTGSSAQIQQFLFGQYKDEVRTEAERTFQVNKSDDEVQKELGDVMDQNQYAGMRVAELKVLLKEKGLSLQGKKKELVARLLLSDRGASEAEDGLDLDNIDIDHLRDMCNVRELSDSGTPNELRARIFAHDKNARQAAHALTNLTIPKKSQELLVTSLKLKPIQFTPAGAAKVSTSILQELSGSDLFGDEKDAVWGTLMDRFGPGEPGKNACRAVGALARIGQIDTMITNFLVPLQALADKNGRIHCSLNLNTETGRLSSRKPNLQNQPALEKDQYKIRDAFVAEEGKTFIVADYGQLELRLLAHITNCQSMIDAFASGGCFHSRTAIGMYPHIREAVDKGDVLLEWDHSKGAPPKPLVKDVYGSERRKAKTLNFSIAYGKTVHGLAKDWGIDEDEAQKVVDAWYSDRPEVKEWQDRTKAFAKKNFYVQTLMGRRRDLPDAGSTGKARGHAMRAAINTPIQGSAADVVMMAMLKLWESEKLKSLGWKLILQIHDEVIMEGPVESKDEAMMEVKACMEHPFDDFALSKLRVYLDVDAKSADTWYKAK